MALTPSVSNAPVRKFAAGDVNSAAIMNVPAQGFLDQSLAITLDLEAIVAIQTTIATRIGQLSDAIALKNNALGLRDVLLGERSQSSDADVRASNVEGAIVPLDSAVGIQGARVAGINSKLDSITPSTYQPYSEILSAIGATAASASNYLYSDAAAGLSYATPALSTGTRMRDIILECAIGAGAASPSIPNETWFNIPMTQSLNMAPDVANWNAGTRSLTLDPGEYSVEGYVVASRTQLVQMSLVQGSSRFLGLTGKGTNQSSVIGTDELSSYSFLVASFKITSARAYNPQIFLSGGAVMPSTMGEATPWAFLRVRHYQY